MTPERTQTTTRILFAHCVVACVMARIYSKTLKRLQVDSWRSGNREAQIDNRCQFRALLHPFDEGLVELPDMGCRPSERCPTKDAEGLEDTPVPNPCKLQDECFLWLFSLDVQSRSTAGMHKCKTIMWESTVSARHSADDSSINTR